MKTGKKETLQKLLLAKPIDLEIYRQECVTGLTVLLYATPWSVMLGIVLALVTLWWASS